MARKTNLGIYKAAQEKWDKANSPHLPQFPFSVLYQESRLEWLKLKVKDFEVTELVRVDLLPFLRKKEFGTAEKLLLSQVGPDRIFHRTKLTGVFTFECNGKQTKRTIDIAPRAVDSDIANDPYNQPEDTDPVYYDDNDGDGPYIQVLSTNVPEDVVLRYVKYPEPYKLIEDPEGFTEEEEAQQNEIIDIAVAKYLGRSRDFQGMQAQELEIQNRGI